MKNSTYYFFIIFTILLFSCDSEKTTNTKQKSKPTNSVKITKQVDFIRKFTDKLDSTIYEKDINLPQKNIFIQNVENLNKSIKTEVVKFPFKNDESLTKVAVRFNHQGKINEIAKFYKNGNVRMKVPVEKSSYHGTMELYSKYGAKIAEIPMKYGRKHGTAYTYYYLNEKKYTEAVFKNDKFIDGQKFKYKDETKYDTITLKSTTPYYALDVQYMRLYELKKKLIKDSTDKFLIESDQYLTYLEDLKWNLLDHCGGVLPPLGHPAFPNYKNGVVKFFEGKYYHEFNKKYHEYIQFCRDNNYPFIMVSMEGLVLPLGKTIGMSFDEIEAEKVKINHIDYTRQHFDHTTIKEAVIQFLILRNNILLSQYEYLLKK